MTRVAAVALVLMGTVSPAFAAGPPSYDVVKTCRIVAGTTGALAEMSYQGCMEAEQRSRSDLTRRWTSIPESIRTDCLAAEDPFPCLTRPGCARPSPPLPPFHLLFRHSGSPVY